MKKTERKKVLATPCSVDEQRQRQRAGERQRHDEGGKGDERLQARAERRVGEHVAVVAQADELGRRQGVARLEQAQPRGSTRSARRRRRRARPRTGRRRPRTTACCSAGRRGASTASAVANQPVSPCPDGQAPSGPARPIRRPSPSGVAQPVVTGAVPAGAAPACTRSSSASTTSRTAAISVSGSAPSAIIRALASL